MGYIAHHLLWLVRATGVDLPIDVVDLKVLKNIESVEDDEFIQPDAPRDHESLNTQILSSVKVKDLQPLLTAPVKPGFSFPKQKEPEELPELQWYVQPPKSHDENVQEYKKKLHTMEQGRAKGSGSNGADDDDEDNPNRLVASSKIMETPKKSSPRGRKNDVRVMSQKKGKHLTTKLVGSPLKQQKGAGDVPQPLPLPLGDPLAKDSEEEVDDAEEAVDDAEEAVDDAEEAVDDAEEAVDDAEEEVDDAEEPKEDSEEEIDDEGKPHL